ncbi:MAG: YdeI/OmpD-associated family protein, partial [Candidatus ainarchaeum sp.]|nr:YdeI/OmpD-associated family protein [Candidatus ainarchaeum sp.]
ARRLIKKGKMTKAGLKKIKGSLNAKFVMPKDILKELKLNKAAWKNFGKFSPAYKRIRIGFIQGARKRPDEFRKRLQHFIKKTGKNKQFGMVK